MDSFKTIVVVSLVFLCSCVVAQDDSIAQLFNIPENEIVSVSIANNPRLSFQSSEKRAVLVEFSDVNCGYCTRFHKNTLGHILDSFVETGQVDYVYKDYVSIGGQESQDAALALRCVHEHAGVERYFDILEKFYRSLGRHGIKRLFEIMTIEFIDNADVSRRLATQKVTSIRECVASKQYLDSLSLEMMEAEAIGVIGTPVYVFGFEVQEGRVHGVLLPGYLHYETLAEYVEMVLE